MNSERNDPRYQEFLRARDERDWAAFVASTASPQATTAVPTQPAHQGATAMPPPPTPRPARITQAYMSARMLPVLQNLPPLLAAHTFTRPVHILPSLGHPLSRHLPRRSIRHTPIRPGSVVLLQCYLDVARTVPLAVPEGPLIESLRPSVVLVSSPPGFVNSSRERMLRISVQVYPPIADGSSLVPGKPNNSQVRLSPAIRRGFWTLEHLVADVNRFASSDFCLEVSQNVNRFIIRLIPMVYPLYRQDAGVKHHCISELAYSRFPRDSGSVALGVTCACRDEVEWEDDIEDEETAAHMLLGSSGSSSSFPFPNSGPSTSSSSGSSTAGDLDPFQQPAISMHTTFAPAKSALSSHRGAAVSRFTHSTGSPCSCAASGVGICTAISPDLVSHPVLNLAIVGSAIHTSILSSHHRNISSSPDRNLDRELAASQGSPTLSLHIRAQDLEDATRQLINIIDECVGQGDCTRLLVKAPRRIFSYSPHMATGPGVEREVLWAVFCSFNFPALLLLREDNGHTLRPLFVSPDVPLSPSTVQLLRRFGAVVALLLISGRWPTPLDPAVLQYFIHGGNLHALHPTFIGEWHPRLRQRLLELLDLGPDVDLTAFGSDFATYLDADASVYRERDLNTHLALASQFLYKATIGTADPKHPCWVAFREGFDLRCAGTDFAFPKARGSEAFLSISASSFISSADVFLAGARFVNPSGAGQWIANLRMLIAQPHLTFQGLFETFLRGQGIPCPTAFEADRGAFPRIVDLSRANTPGWRGQIAAWAATGSPFIDVTSDLIEIGPIATDDPMYSPEHSQSFANFGTVCFRTCTRSMRYPIDYLLGLATTQYNTTGRTSDLSRCIRLLDPQAMPGHYRAPQHGLDCFVLFLSSAYLCFPFETVMTTTCFSLDYLLYVPVVKNDIE
ncbi:hypothetical protein MSAN_01028300 [Mycena sanguinolenta]|uniref:Uncharacterized protein n=1 Tax=Mycena sanguinolenta TaxID=230812 RepID=A0A8H6YM89_9AGAR|nr:hypothetical protein MSAN_01028300 [Mycena sanguinolenta]